MTSGSRPPLALVLLLLLALPGAAPGLDVKLWPLFRYAREEASGTVRWSALGPLLEYTGTEDARDLHVRPLLWLHQKRGSRPDDFAEILYPLASSRWAEDYQSFRFLLFTYRTSPRPGAEHARGEPPPPETWPSRLTLFPFLFYRQDPEAGMDLSVFPFYLDQDDWLGYRHATAIMFPAYLRLEEPGVDTRFYGFPFVSTIGGELGSGVRVWPFYGRREIAGRDEEHYVLWPFHLRRRHLVRDYGWVEERLNLPVFAAVDSAERRTRAWGLVAYTHTVDERLGYESTGSPWPFAVRERALGETEYRTWRLLPFYGRSDHRGISSCTYAWPAYRWKAQDEGDFHYERRDVGWVLWRRQELRNAASGREETIHTLVPLLRSVRDNERHFGQAPALLDSLMPRNRGFLALWAPVYGLYRWDTRTDGSEDWSLLYGLAAREGGRLRGPWYLDGG